MALSLVVTVQPNAEPITLDEAKIHLRVSNTVDDGYIDGLIAASRIYLEKFLGRCFITQTLRQSLDAFPDMPNASLKFFTPTYSVESYLARAISLMSGPLRLLRSPVASVVTVTYVDNNGTTQTLTQNPAPGLPGYIVDIDNEPARLAPANTLPWPVTLAIQNAVKVTFIAGYGDPKDVPETIKHSIKLLVGQLYENREPISEKMSFKVPGLDALSWMDRIYEIP